MNTYSFKKKIEVSIKKNTITIITPFPIDMVTIIQSNQNSLPSLSSFFSSFFLKNPVRWWSGGAKSDRSPRQGDMWNTVVEMAATLPTQAQLNPGKQPTHVGGGSLVTYGKNKQM